MNKQEQATSQTGAKGAARDQEDSSKRSEGGDSKIHEVAEQARKAATEQVDSIRDSVESAKTRAAERVRKLGQVVRKIGEHMRVEDQQYIADQANRASQHIEAVASYMGDAEINTLINDSETIARKRPTLVFGGAFLLGLAAGRFFKTPMSSGALTTEPPKDLPQQPSKRIEASTRREEPASKLG